MNEIMQFAGCWENMPEETFTDFCEDIEHCRQIHHGDLRMKPC